MAGKTLSKRGANWGKHFQDMLRCVRNEKRENTDRCPCWKILS